MNMAKTMAEMDKAIRGRCDHSREALYPPVSRGMIGRETVPAMEERSGPSAREREPKAPRSGWGVMKRFPLKPLVLAFLGLEASAKILPDVPLGLSRAAKPMVMIVAARDHKLFYEAYNDASDLNGDGILDTRFNPNFTYIGLFDPKLCYDYVGNRFRPVAYARNGKCPGRRWSGNWLNYATTSRIDALRKVLYGGYREVDTRKLTILRRAYIPQDAHSWAKEYTSPQVDGYRISDYTPFSEPKPGRRHFFGNYTPVASKRCDNLDSCSNRPPFLAVVLNSYKRVWEWASKERPVLDKSHGGRSIRFYRVRVEVCTQRFHDGCKRYPSGHYKPVGLLQEYADSILFGLLTGSYNKNMSGGVVRKVVSSFEEEVDPKTGVFKNRATIVRTFDRLRIRDFNHGTTANHYRGGWLTTRPMREGEFIDWGNPLAEMMYEALRYFAGKKRPTSAYMTAGGNDNAVGLPVTQWNDPYQEHPWCARPNLLVISDIYPSFDSDQLPGSAFGSFGGDLSGLNVKELADVITAGEPGVRGLHFIGQSGSNYDGAPTAKRVDSLGTIRGLAPDEPTKQGSYYSASVAYFGKTHDLHPIKGEQKTDSFFIALASPLPRIEIPVGGGRKVTLVPFAKSVGGCLGVKPDRSAFQPTNQIVDFYVDTLANVPGAPPNPNINGGRPYVKFRINFEDVEQGADHDMDAIVEYEVFLREDGKMQVNLKSTYAAGCIIQHMGYVISGTTRDGVYLVVRDKDTAANRDVDYFLDVPDEPGPLPLTSSRTFTPGGSAATLLPDPLWFAAKWGGFTDLNGNDRPDLRDEWDADHDGVPDNYFLVQSPLKLKEALGKVLRNIATRRMAASGITVTSGTIESDTLVFQAVFESEFWSGELWAFPVQKEGILSVPRWRASQNLQPQESRRIFTTSGGRVVAFRWSELAPEDRAALGQPEVVDYLRGERSLEARNGGPFRNRHPESVLGDIVHTTPVYVKEADTVFVGANDGMLHAFDAITGKELFAYIPSVLIPKLRQLTHKNYSHAYFVDGQIAVSSRTLTAGRNLLVATLGHGGKGLFALEVTNPQDFGPRNVLWEYFDPNDRNLGYMIGQPVIARMNDGSDAVIVANGYNSQSGQAVLYIFDLDRGTVLKKIDTGAGDDNGLSTPAVVDDDGDGDVDWIYAGDLQGNVWKFDVRAPDPAGWRIAFGGQPLFIARDPEGRRQPITAPLTVARDTAPGDPNYGKRFIFFGTGSYLFTSDPTDRQVQSWYGIIDGDDPIPERDALRPGRLKSQGEVSDRTVRTFEPARPDEIVGKRGWFIDFPAGERIVTPLLYLPDLIEPVLMAVSRVPRKDPCLSGGDGFVNFINPWTGGSVGSGIIVGFEKLGNEFIGSVQVEEGMPVGTTVLQPPPGEEKTATLLVGTSEGKKDSFDLRLQPVTGRRMWREIILE